MTDQTNPVEPTARVQTTLTAPEWPRDVYSMTSGLRREIARSAGRLNGDPQKLAVFMDTLKAGAKWAHSRMEVQQQIKDKGMSDAIKRSEAEQVYRDKDSLQNGAARTPAERSAQQTAAGVKGGGINGQ